MPPVKLLQVVSQATPDKKARLLAQCAERQAQLDVEIGRLLEERGRYEAVAKALGQIQGDVVALLMGMQEE